MTRLVVTGLPCSALGWESWLGKKRGQRILTMREVFENTASSDPREMSQYITRVLDKERPQSIVCHDMGVPLVLMGLLRLWRRGTQWKTRLILFNGAFRQVPLGKAIYPLRFQWMTQKQMLRAAQEAGAEVDPELTRHIPRIRAMYRYIILYRLSEKLTTFLGLDDFAGFPGKLGFPVPVKIIASKNDPYLPFDTIEQLKRDLKSREFVEVEYGHFPYSVPPEKILPHLESFESAR